MAAPMVKAGVRLVAQATAPEQLDSRDSTRSGMPMLTLAIVALRSSRAGARDASCHAIAQVGLVRRELGASGRDAPAAPM